MKTILTIIVLFFLVSCGYKEAREKVFKRQIGSYVLDIQRTNLGKFKNDSLKFKNLKITFYKDSTFNTNMAVPFLYEEKGKWIVDAGSIDSWNWLSYKSWLKNKEINIGDGSQFTHLYKSGNDSIFYIKIILKFFNLIGFFLNNVAFPTGVIHMCVVDSFLQVLFKYHACII